MVVNVKQMVCNEGNSDFSSIVTDNDETHKRDTNKKSVGIYVLKIIISSSRSTPTNKSFQGLHPQLLNKKYYHPNAIFREKIANLLTIFYGPKLQILHSAIFLDQN